MNPIESKIAETVARQDMEDKVGMMAATTPLPGPLADAFAPQPDIVIGPFKVRPFYDADFEFLSWLEHPLHRFMLKGEGEDFVPRGPMAWELCWLMTRPIEEVEKIFAAGGRKAVSEAARGVMGRLQIAALTALCDAAIRQMTVYWSPVLKYGAATEKKEGEVAQEPQNPISTVPPPTA
jgi:hypothetical protein